MVGRHILVLIAIGMLVFGCFAPPSGGPTGAETGGTGAAGSGIVGGGAGATGGQTGGTGATGGETGATDGQQGGDQTGSAGQDLVGKTYDELLGLEIPMQCDMTMTSDGQTTTIRIYMKNSGEMRNEITLEGVSMCTKMISIMKGNTIYSGCEGEKYPPGSSSSCDWLTTVIEETNATAGTSQPSDYSNVPATQINCVPWVPDDSKFATPGHVCTQEDLMNEMMNQYN
ncbi:MAG: hypothetical protein PHF60_02500 [Candidatus ainarchaeum sp.]|nr:hypothetical protein [Candidatus ainarchaeum sp.]